MASPATLEIRDLAVAAGGRGLLEGLAFALPAGEGLALSGPSGCGKSTLLRAVAGLDDPRRGELRLAGRPPEDWGWPLYRRRVLMLTQKPVFLEASPEENLRLPFSFRNAPGPYPAERADRLVERLGLSDAFAGGDARRLSQGEQQRLALIRALLLEPDAILLDEPSSSLDPESTTLIEGLLHEEREARGLALLLVSHEAAQPARLGLPVMDLRAHRPREARP